MDREVCWRLEDDFFVCASTIERSNSRYLILCCNVCSVARRCWMLAWDLCAGVIKALMVGRSALGSSTRRSRSKGSVRADGGPADEDLLLFCLFIVDVCS